MYLFIEGTAFPLGELNKNSWGVPPSEAENAISSLKNSVIRICPIDAPHICGILEDPFAENSIYIKNMYVQVSLLPLLFHSHSGKAG